MAGTPIPGRPVRGSTTGRPIMALFDLMGRRWALRVIWELRDGEVTFRELASRCDDVSSSVLRDRLRDLTVAGIVERGDGGYRLTADGCELRRCLRPLGQWSQRWAARMSPDERTATTPGMHAPGRRRRPGADGRSSCPGR